MTGTRTAAVAAIAAAVLAGCGGGGGSSTQVAKQTPTSTAPSAQTGTTASSTHTAAKPARKAQTKHAPVAPQKSHGQPVAPASPKLSAAAKRLNRLAAQEQRGMIALSKLCTRPKTAAKLPALPKSTSQMGRYARAVLPTVRRNARALAHARVPGVGSRVGSLAVLYDTAQQLLEQIGDPSASDDLVKALGPPAARQVAALHTAAIGMGAPHCALPV